MEEDSETDYSDMEDDFEVVSPVTTTTTSTDCRSVSDDVRNMNFITTNLDRKVSPRQSPKERREEERVVAAGSSREEKSLRAKGMVDNTSLEETTEKGNVRLQKRPSIETLTVQFEKAASTSAPSIPTSSLKWPRSQNHQGSPHSPSTLSDISSSELTSSEKTTGVNPSSSSLRGNNSSDTTPLSTSHNRTPSIRSAGSGASPEPSKRFNSSSEEIASRIASLFSGNQYNSEDKGSPPPTTLSDEARNTTTMMNGNVKNQNQNGSAVQSPDIPLTNEMALANETPLMLNELELILPDFESKIRDEITKSVGENYGGLEKATQAAIKIQQSWRQFKLRSRFQKIKQQNKSQLQQQLRQRAQTMRNPRRRPSIMKKRGKRAYDREASIAAIPSTEQQKAGKSSGLIHVAGTKVKIERQLTEQRDETEVERKKVIEIVEVGVDLELGNTPLHRAVDGGHSEAVKQLLLSQTNLDIENNVQS